MKVYKMNVSRCKTIEMVTNVATKLNQEVYNRLIKGHKMSTYK